MMRITLAGTFALALAGCNIYSSSTGPDGGTRSHTDPGTVAIDLTFAPGWVGNVELLVHDGGGRLVARQSLGVHTVVAIDPPQTFTLAAEASDGTQLVTYYGLGGGDAIAPIVGASPIDSTRQVAVGLPANGAAATWFASGPSTEGQASANTDVSVNVPSSRTTVPMLGAAIDAQSRVLAMYADPAANVTGSAVALAQPVTVDEVAIDPGTVPAGATVQLSGYVEVGRDDLFTADLALGSANRTAHFPHGLGDRDDVGVIVSSTTTYLASGASFEGTPPSTLDVATLPVTAPDLSGAAFDGTRFAWTTAGGAHSLQLDWYMQESSNAQYLSWSFVAPPGTAPPVVPVLPPDLGPTAPWSYGGMIAYAGDFATDYYDMIATPGFAGHGTYHWQMRAVVMTLPGQAASPLSVSARRGQIFSRSQVAQ